MGSIPALPAFVAGQKVTAAQLNSMNDFSSFLLTPPQCSAYQGVAQNLTTGTWGAITLDAEVFDIVQSGDTASHDNATNNSRIYIRTTGKYEVSGQVQIATSATGLRAAQVRLNAAGAVGSGSMVTQNQQSPVSGGSTSVAVGPYVQPFTAGDYIELFGFQSSGGTVATVIGQGTTFLRLKFVAA